MMKDESVRASACVGRVCGQWAAAMRPTRTADLWTRRPVGRHFTAKAADTGTLPTIPSWLADDPAAYAKDPRAAAIQWMRQAKYGLFLH
jgi:hypothetical protein